MHNKLSTYTALVVLLLGAGTALAFALPNNSVQASGALTVKASCCDGSCCPDGDCCPGPCCLAATKTKVPCCGLVAKKTTCCDGSCCPDGPCCPGPCCDLSVAKATAKK